MKTFGHDISIDVDARPEEVWDVLGDYGRDAEWREGVTMRCEPAGLAREGTRTFEELVAFGETHRKVARLTDVVPGRSLRFVGEDGTFAGTREVVATGGGSRVRVTLEVHVAGLLALAAPLLGWVFARRVRGDLARLAAVVTSSRAASGRASREPLSA